MNPAVAQTPIQVQLQGAAARLLPWMEDEAISDILINGTDSVYLDRGGELVATDNPFLHPHSLDELIERLLVPLGKRLDAATPWVDGRLADGSRFHLIASPIANPGPLLSIRKFLRRGCLYGFTSPDRWELLLEHVSMRKNILISGGTGAGKTTLLGVLLDHIGKEERLVIIEETREIQTAHPHAVFLEARSACPEGRGEVTLRHLVRNALRMRPHRIVLGECRGGEALDVLQAMHTGHPGSLCTLHANNARDALRRFELLAHLGASGVGEKTIREWVGCGVDLVVQLGRQGGHRRITEILAVEGVEGQVFRIRPIVSSGENVVPRLPTSSGLI